MLADHLQPKKYPPISYEEAVAQLARSVGNMRAQAPVIPECLRGLENAGGGAEHCVMIPRWRKAEAGA